MIAKQSSSKFYLFIIFSIFHFGLSAQVVKSSAVQQKTGFYELRANNAVDFAAGTSIINGDLKDPKFELFFHASYKRYIIPLININLSYNKFNLAYTDVYNEGFMSFDLNVESTLLPHNRLSPFIFAGGGYNASNDFDKTAIKFQGGGGLEYIVIDGLGIKLYADYNQVMSDELDGVIAGDSDDTYIRIGFGVNYYFGGAKKKTETLKEGPTTIDSNQIILLN